MSLFDVGEDLRMNPFEERRNDENMTSQRSTSTTFVSSSSNKDPSYIHGGPITRTKIKKMKEVLISSIEGIWREKAKEEVQDELLMSQDD